MREKDFHNRVNVICLNIRTGDVASAQTDFVNFISLNIGFLQ